MSIWLKNFGFSSGTAKSLTYKGHYEDTSGDSIFSQVACDIGNPSGNRYVIVAIASQGTPTVSTLLVNGVSATILNTATRSTTLRVTFAIALVPSGSSVTISGTMSAASDIIGITWWTAYGLNSPTVQVTANNNAANGTPIVLSPAVLKNYVVVGVGLFQSASVERYHSTCSLLASADATLTMNFDTDATTAWTGDAPQNHDTFIDAVGSNAGQLALMVAFN
tara:strand:+ start:85 stop:750 length:666 start_codon:yes stop_codon:yes gene_type:complete